MALTKTCPICGIVFSTKPSENHTCCSKKCSGQFRRVLFPRPCAQCGTPYTPKKSRPSRFCSNKCQGLSIRDRASVQCRHCGKWVTVTKGRVPGFRYCSHACRARAVSVGVYIGVGVQHPSPNKPYHRSYWVKQSGRARKRDGYKCQHCGREFVKGTGQLHAHHIIPIRLGGSDHLDNIVSLCRSCHKKADDLIRSQEHPYQLRLVF